MKKCIAFFVLITAGIMQLHAQKTKPVQRYGCSTEQPAPKYYLPDTTNARGLADNYYLWDNGKTLYIRFLTGNPVQQDRIKNIIKQWELYANLHFEFVTTGSSHIRINLDNKGGHNSLIGTMALGVAPDEKTMNFDTTDFRTYAAMYRTVLHEFGHAIGLLHEHYSPVSGIPWNKEAVYADLQRSQGWDKETVDVNLFGQYAVTYTNGTKYDRYSIMHYPIMAQWTTNGYSVDWNNSISAGDKELVALLYPKAGERQNEVPRFSVSDYTNMSIVKNATKQGLSLYPSFSINTAGKQGTVYFIAFFYDEYGNPIKKETQQYNVSNTTATFKAFTLQPGKKLSANKLSPQDFELFIPYAEIPVAQGNQKVQVVFKVFLMDDKELKMLYSSKPVNFSLIKS